ncbi:MAG: hypothetical protein QME21_08280 [Anaerolineales bacterium]|nr:hypothetical protein [Anaerolineales bacterium]
MFKSKRLIWILIGSALFVGLAVVAGAVVTTRVVNAASSAYGRAVNLRLAGDVAPALESFYQRGGPGFPGMGPDQDTYLAQALGITVDELQAAYSAAQEKALEQAVEQGLLTQEQADAIKARGGFFGRGFKHGGWRGEGAQIDFEALLADALNITVEELQAARQQAADAALADAVKNGDLTQEEADLMKARRALEAYIDKEALTAQALGLSVEELQAAREAGKTIPELIEEQGMTAAEARQAMQEAYKEAVQQAVKDGVITQAQADQILACCACGFGFDHGGFAPMPGFGGRGGRGPGGFDRPLTPPSDDATGSGF